MPTECLGNVASAGDRTVRYLPATDVETQSLLMDQPFASSEMGDSMDADLLPELSGETWVASALLEELTADLPTAGSDIDLIAASRDDSTLGTVRSWLQSGSVPPWSACVIARFALHESHLAHEGLLWVEVGHRWDHVAMDLLDMSVTTTRGNIYVLVMVDCFSRWTEACPLPDKTAQSVADAFFSQIVCRFGMPIVIHSDQGREFENRIMQELCILCGSHKTRTTPYHPESDG